MPAGNILSELNRVPPEMRSMQNRLQLLQQMANGTIQLGEDIEEKTPSIRDDEVKVQPIEKKETIVEAPNVIIPEEAKDYNSISIGYKDLPDLDKLAEKVSSKVLEKLNNSFEIKKQSPTDFTATLKIDVLSYSFSFQKLHKTPQLLIFVLKDNFSLEIKNPVKFLLSTNDINAYDDEPVVCLGAPIILPELGIKFLLFGLDN